MTLVNRTVSKAAASLIIWIAGCFLVACQSGGVNFGLPEQAPQTPPAAELPEPKGEVVGNGDVRVAMLLPLTAPGNGRTIATELKNAAIMAMEEWGSDTIELVIKDTAGTPGGAVDAATEASEEQATLVLGPLFSGNVSAVTGVLRPAGKTIIAFSSDSSVAGDGVYVLSYLPQTVIDRTLTFALSSGFGSVVAFLPEGTAGNLAESQVRKTLAQRGGTLLSVVRYEYNDASVQAAIESALPNLEQAQAIFIPDGGTTPAAILGALKRRGVSLKDKKILGTGQWASADLKNPVLQGAWLADTDQNAVAGFKAKYTARFGSEPSAVAPLGYDAVALLAGIIKNYGAIGLNKEVFETKAGFAGYTGIFRFLPDGSNERGLAIYEISGGVMKIVNPAPPAFGRES